MENSGLSEYRLRLLEKLLESADDFCSVCRRANDIYQFIDSEIGIDGLLPPGWNIHRLAVHVRDVDREAYGLRARRTLREQNPTFPKFHADPWMVAHYDLAEPLEKILDEFQDSIHELVNELHAQPKSVWSRLGRHEIQGKRTLQIWVEQDLAHIREHLAIARKAPNNA